MSGLRIGELFAGFGGLGMSVKDVFPDAEVAWVSEFDKGPSKVLAHRFPDAPNLGDITQIDWTQVPPVDVLTGGFPCQDVSHAGKRAGLRRGETRTGLWAEMLAAIDTLRPPFVLAENVRGLLSAGADSDMEPCAWCMGDDGGQPPMRALGAVLADLADVGYDAAWCGLRAADVGAAHGRFRVFVLAWRHGATVPEADALGLQRGGGARVGRAGPADDGGGAVKLLPTTSTMDAATGHFRAPASERRGRQIQLSNLGAEPDRWGDYAAAIQRWEHVIGRAAPEPTQVSTKGNPQLSARFTEWLMGVPDGWITDVPGVTRNEALKMCGNGVVVAQGAAAIRWMLQQIEEHA